MFVAPRPPDVRPLEDIPKQQWHGIRTEQLLCMLPTRTIIKRHKQWMIVGSRPPDVRLQVDIPEQQLLCRLPSHLPQE